MIPLLSSFYFGSVEHYRLLMQQPKAIIDLGEHYERQSYRSRSSIVGPNGKQDLSVQVVHDHGNKMRSRDVRSSYAETWPAQHLHAIRSAYGQTPWFIHYIDGIEAVVMKKYDRLFDLQLATIDLAMKWLGLTTEIGFSDSYVEKLEGLIDLRSSFHPKKPLPAGVVPVAPYTQVFADRHGFIPRMSVIDLVCNCGPDARRILLV